MKRLILLLVGGLPLLLSPVALARNVILFIGDGMGFEHVQAGRLYIYGSSGVGMSFEGLPYRGRAITTLPSGAVTDSATAGTALATGYQHPANGVISMDAQGLPVPTILELAKSLGQRVGIVTTDDIGGATPGAFGAHEPDRNLMEAIRYDYLLDDTDHPASLPNVLLGGGANVTYAGTASSLGYTVVWNDLELAGLDLSGAAAPAWILGQFATGTLTRENDRLPDNPQPRLSTMVSRALEVLAHEGAGFFLIVEGALIDKLSHDNAGDDLCPEMAQFHAAVQTALDWVATQGGFAETLVLVTADHETGGLNVPDDQIVSPGQVPAFTFSSTGHTATDVPVYASWPPTLEGVRIDNTEVYFVLEDWLAGPYGQPPEITGLSADTIKQDSAVITWTTREPATARIECYAGIELAASGADPSRATSHVFALAGLMPDTEYQVEVESTDLAGYLGTASLTFRTATPDSDAYVIDEPQVSLGSVVGAASALALPGDGLTQMITEAPTDLGSGLEVLYTLHTSAEVQSIVDLTLNAAFTWSNRDRTGDGLEVAVYNALYGTWEPLALTSGVGAPLPFPQAYVDDAGDLRVRFVDTQRFTREKKDTLTLDWLQATVVAGAPDREAPAQPVNLSVVAPANTELTALLSWAPGAIPPDPDLAGYYILREGAAEAVFTIEPSWTDRVMTAGEYTYQVAAVDFSGNVSLWADSMPVTLDNHPPAAPTGLRAQAGDQSVTLEWEPNPEWDVVGYNIYRELSEGSWELLDEGVTQPYFQVFELVNGLAYTFSIEAVDGGAASPRTQLTVTPSAVPKVWADRIDLSLSNAGKNWKATAVISVITTSGPASGATVSGQWYLDNQPLGSMVTGTTDSLGQTVSTSSPVKTNSGTFTYRVEQVTLPGFEYDPPTTPTESSITVNP